jgi:hypothetical protein
LRDGHATHRQRSQELIFGEKVTVTLEQKGGHNMVQSILPAEPNE